MENIFWSKKNGRSGCRYGSTVNFDRINLSLIDAIQIVLTRMLSKDHPALYGEQAAFENYVKKSARFAEKSVSAWDRQKVDLELWEIQDITPSSKAASMDLDGLGLTGREKEYLSLQLQGEVNADIADRLAISERSGAYIRKNIVKKLKKTAAYDAVKVAIQRDQSVLHSVDLADLRYRKVYGRDYAETQRVKDNPPTPGFCSLYPACPLPLPAGDHHQPSGALRASDYERRRVNALPVYIPGS